MDSYEFTITPDHEFILADGTTLHSNYTEIKFKRNMDNETLTKKPRGLKMKPKDGDWSGIPYINET